MKCPKCSNVTADDSEFCCMCGYDLKSIDTAKIVIDKSDVSQNISEVSTIQEGNDSSRTLRIAFGVGIIIIGIIAWVQFNNAATQISSAATDMTLIRSQSGTSVAEMYYQDMGKALLGIAVLSRGFGFSILALTFYGGGRKLLP